jgi:GNAT superfamily N-acetyltransferase
VIVRRATEADVGGIRALTAEVDELHREALPWLFRKTKEPRVEEPLTEFFSDPEHAAFVAEAPGGGLAGVLLMLIRSPKPNPIVRATRIAELDALVVGRAFHRQGVGTALFRAGLAWGCERDATRAELGVYEFNEPARAFWASVGFETLSRRMMTKVADG